MAANAAPAAPPNAAPTKVEPVRKAPAKPQAAPMIIMPSTPRLSTPERSATSSPAAASSSGVEAAITDRTMASTSSMRSLSRHADEADAMDDQGIADEHVEQQHPLKDLNEIERHLQGDLRALAANEGQRKKQAGDQDAERIEPSEKRDDDGREAVAGEKPGCRCPTGPATSMMPARPASAPDSAKANSTSWLALNPAKAAARGAAPTTRISKPLTVRPSSTAASATRTSVATAPACRRLPSIKVGTVATGSNSAVVGKLRPCGSRQGPRTR